MLTPAPILKASSQRVTLLAGLYQNASKLFCGEMTKDKCTLALISRSNTVQDIETLVINAQKNFEQSRNRKLKKWLGRVTRSLMYYGNIFDVLAQHHPEYVALAWGAMKFLLVVSLFWGERSDNLLTLRFVGSSKS